MGDVTPVGLADQRLAGLRPAAGAAKTGSLGGTKVLLAYAVAIAILLAVGAFAYRSILESAASDRLVRQTQEVLENIEQVLVAVTEIEWSVRGFMLTGDDSYLEAYRASKLSAEQHVAAVRSQTEGNPEQQRWLPALEDLIAQRIRFAERAADLRRTGGLEAAVDTVRSGQGQQITASLRAIIGRLRDEELKVLTIRGADATQHESQTKAILIFGTLLGLLITAAAAWSVQRDGVRRGRAEAALRDSEGQYRGLLEAAPDAMVVVNQEGRIVLVNLQAERQFGYRRDEFIGQQVTIIIPEGFAERLIADGLRSAEDALAQRIGTGIELTAQRKDGSEFPIEIMLNPLASADGILVTAAIRDITERKSAEAYLLQKVEELKRSNEELGQFAYIASHDLQEPLRMVASYTQLLSRRYKGKLDSDADDFIEFAVDGANRMQRLIQDLLAYSRVGTKGRDLLETSSEAAFGQALINLRGAILEGGAEVTHDPLPAVMADEVQLVQLFQNLIGNAIKYQGSGVPKVHVSAARDEARRWNFAVKDNGLGIDPKYFTRIFGMFQRLHKRDEFAGTGIGLAICKKIVERHGGNISVESEPGLGSTFRFALPGTERTA